MLLAFVNFIPENIQVTYFDRKDGIKLPIPRPTLKQKDSRGWMNLILLVILLSLSQSYIIKVAKPTCWNFACQRIILYWSLEPNFNSKRSFCFQLHLVKTVIVFVHYIKSQTCLQNCKQSSRRSKWDKFFIHNKIHNKTY